MTPEERAALKAQAEAALRARPPHPLSIRAAVEQHETMLALLAALETAERKRDTLKAALFCANRLIEYGVWSKSHMRRVLVAVMEMGEQGSGELPEREREETRTVAGYIRTHLETLLRAALEDDWEIKPLNAEEGGEVVALPPEPAPGAGETP